MVMKYFAVDMTDGVFEHLILELDECLEPEEEAEQLPYNLGSSADSPVECTAAGIFDSKCPVVPIGHWEHFQVAHAESEIAETHAELDRATDEKAIESLQSRIEYLKGDIRLVQEVKDSRDSSGRAEPPPDRTYWLVELTGARAVDFVTLEGPTENEALNAYLACSTAQELGQYPTRVGKLAGNPLDAPGILLTAECLRYLS